MPVDTLPLRSVRRRRPGDRRAQRPPPARSLRAAPGRAAAHRRSRRARRAPTGPTAAATFGFLVRVLGDRAAAEDVQQQVFTEVWRRAGDYDPRARRAAHVGADDRAQPRDRSPAPARPRAARPAATRPAARCPPTPTRCSSAGASRTLLGRLPEDERALLRLRFYDELSQSEISAATGIPHRDGQGAHGARAHPPARDDRGRGRMNERRRHPRRAARGGRARAAHSGARSGTSPNRRRCASPCPTRERRRRRWGTPLLVRPAIAVAMAIALVVLGAAGGALLTGGRDGAAPGQEVALAPVGDGPRAARGDARLASATMRLTVSGLPRVGGGGFYEVWMLRDPAHLVALGQLPGRHRRARARRPAGHGERPALPRAGHLARARRRRSGALGAFRAALAPHS